MSDKIFYILKLFDLLSKYDTENIPHRAIEFICKDLNKIVKLIPKLLTTIKASRHESTLGI